MAQQNPKNSDDSAVDEHRLVAMRREKAEKLRENFPHGAESWDITHSLVEAKAHFEGQSAEFSEPVRVAGRVTARRNLGKVVFVDIASGGEQLQAQLRPDLATAPLEMLEFLDLGDFVGVGGRLFRTKRGEITVETTELAILSKALQPPPDKWGGLKNLEVRRRQRYLDMIARNDAVQLALTRTKIIAAVRDFMIENAFVEVETPILNPIAAGAFASRFKTKHTWTEHDLYLRVATELPLKKLLVGGLERVYEIGKVFRNERVDKSHSAEFTSMEAYQAFGDYNAVMALTENLFATVAKKVNGTTILPAQNDGSEAVDVAPPWVRLNLLEEIEKRCGINLLEVRERGQLISAIEDAKKANKFERPGALKIGDDMSWARIVDHLISVVIEPHLYQPCFLVDYPVETTPLARRSPHNANIVERAEGFVCGVEVANMFSELADPDEQRQRMEEMEQLNLQYRQKKPKAEQDADTEHDRLDPDFLTALRYGMPPAGGVGVGIDRMVMLLTGETNIGDVILFPSLYDAV